MKKDILEQLYASPELEGAYQQGILHERRTHKCQKKEVVIKPHPRLRWGIVNNGLLLNMTYANRRDAEQGLLGLVPANPAMREKVKIDAQVIRLR